MSDQQHGPPPDPSEQVGPPTCPRHPDRVSYVRCQRCGRPACPECQRPAAVGVHCVDCVREAQARTPQPRTAFGAPLRGGRPVVTLTLIGLCVVSYVLQRVPGTGWADLLVFSPVLGGLEPYRFLTTAFLHSTAIYHILFNMYALWITGSWLEPALGRWRFAALYLVSALGGSVAITLLATPWTLAWITPVVGASGAVFGLFGALLVVLRRLGRNAGPIVAILAINGVIGFVVPNISWEAHLGGLLTGAALGAAFAYAPKGRRTLVSVIAVVAVTAVLVALAVATYATAAAP